jgi:hypothetical protein
MTDQQRLAMQSLSMDLLRIALGRHRGQVAMAKRFTEEAHARLAELPELDLHDKITTSLNSSAERSAEDLLMYSTLVKNRALV